MKKISILLIIIMLCLCGCSKVIVPNHSAQDNGVPEPDTTPNQETQDNKHSASTTDILQSNSVIYVDVSKIVKVDAPDCLPVSTESIRDILNDTGRFTYNRVRLPVDGGAIADIYFFLDKPDVNDSEGAAHVTYQILAENTTQIISYNFSKSAVNGDKHDTIKWGLGMLLHIFGTELIDEAWVDIMEIAAKSETEDAWGTDYDGCADGTSGIRLVYSNLGKNVQIDIRPY